MDPSVYNKSNYECRMPRKIRVWNSLYFNYACKSKRICLDSLWFQFTQKMMTFDISFPSINNHPYHPAICKAMTTACESFKTRFNISNIKRSRTPDNFQILSYFSKHKTIQKAETKTKKRMVAREIRKTGRFRTIMNGLHYKATQV